MHDRIAELRGLQAELENCENGPRTSRSEAASEVRAQIERVRKELSDQADALDADAETLTDKGQDVAAATAAVDAREIRAALEAHTTEKPKAQPAGTTGKRTAKAAPAPEHA